MPHKRIIALIFKLCHKMFNYSSGCWVGGFFLFLSVVMNKFFWMRIVAVTTINTHAIGKQAIAGLSAWAVTLYRMPGARIIFLLYMVTVIKATWCGIHSGIGDNDKRYNVYLHSDSPIVLVVVVLWLRSIVCNAV